MIRTGIPVPVWAEMGERAIVTAIDVLAEEDRRAEEQVDDDGRQMSG